jgi:hypothetical protein
MIVGVWRSSADAIPERLASELAALLDARGANRVDEASATLAVWPAAHIQRQGRAATAWAVSNGSGHVPPGLPSVRLESDTLTVEAPAIPQFPFYYVRGKEDSYLLVSSRFEPLARLLPKAPLNEQRMVSIIAAIADPDRGATIYQGIRRLLPSEVITAGPEGLHVSRSLPRIGRNYRQGRVEDLAAELRDRLDAAVGRAIGSTGRVAVLVSGGLDSSGVLALAAARCRGANQREVRAISLQAMGPGDDRPYFVQLAKALGIAPVRVSPSDAGPWFRPSLCADGQPAPNGAPACFDMLLCATVASLRADIGLSGGAGDHICGGSLPFAQLARRGHAVEALNAALRVRVPWRMTPWGRVRTFLIRPFLPRAVLRAKRCWTGPSPWMTRRFRALLERCHEASERAARPLPDTPDEWMQEWCEGDDCVLPTIADCSGRSHALTGAAVLDAFMDFDFVRFMFEIDPVLLSYGHEYRGLYRLAMKGILPEQIRTRQDKASYEPAFAAAVLAADAIGMVRDLSSLEALASRGLVDPGPFRPMFTSWLSAVKRGEREESDPGDEWGQQVWQLLSVEAFLRQHASERDLA